MQHIRVMPSDKHIIGDVKISRTRPIGVNAFIDILKTASLDCQPARTGNIFVAGQKSNIGIAYSKALKIMVVGCHDIEEIEIIVTVKNYLAVARSLDHNGLLLRPLGC